MTRSAARPFLSLSYGQKRLVLLARALIRRPDWLLEARIVNHNVPLASAQRVELALAVADQRFNARGYSIDGGFAAIEVGYLPVQSQSFAGEVGADETGAAQNQQSPAFGGLRWGRGGRRCDACQGTRKNHASSSSSSDLQQVTTRSH